MDFAQEEKPIGVVRNAVKKVGSSATRPFCEVGVAIIKGDFFPIIIRVENTFDTSTSSICLTKEQAQQLVDTITKAISQLH